jgi:hypothetical protein
MLCCGMLCCAVTCCVGVNTGSIATWDVPCDPGARAMHGASVTSCLLHPTACFARPQVQSLANTDEPHPVSDIFVQCQPLMEMLETGCGLSMFVELCNHGLSEHAGRHSKALECANTLGCV